MGFIASFVTNKLFSAFNRTTPCAGESIFARVTAVGGPETQDASGNPQTPSDDLPAGALTLKRDNGEGSTIQVRLVYPGNTANITQQLQVRLFGNTHIDATRRDEPGNIVNNNGQIDVTITADPDLDAIGEDGMKRTTINIDAHSFDSQNCNHFRFGIIEELQHDGTAATSYLEAKII